MNYSWLAKNCLLVLAALIHQTKQEFTVQDACSRGSKGLTFPLPGTKSETIQIAFECKKTGAAILSCKLPDIPAVRLSDKRRQTYVSKRGKVYEVTCWSETEPDIVENFPASVCATTAKASNVEIIGQPGKTIDVAFVCEKDNQRFKSCRPEGSSKYILAGDPEVLLVDQRSGKGKYIFSCNSDFQPDIRLTFAAEICNSSNNGRSKKYTPPDYLEPVTVTFECNDNGQIKSCKPNDRRPIRAGDKDSWGGPLGLDYKLTCDSMMEPTFS